MPTYEYKCSGCNKTFEEFQSIKDKPLKECRFCKGPVKRIIHPAGIVFKGSGFHVTDYGKSNRTGESRASVPPQTTALKTADKKSSSEKKAA